VVEYGQVTHRRKGLSTVHLFMHAECTKCVEITELWPYFDFSLSVCDDKIANSVRFRANLVSVS
jgi:hypothetical protein